MKVARRRWSFGWPGGIQTDEGGARENDIWTALCAQRRIRVQFRGAGARPWILKRRNGLGRGIYNRLMADGRFSRRRIPSEVRRSVHSHLGSWAFSLPGGLWVQPGGPF